MEKHLWLKRSFLSIRIYEYLMVLGMYLFIAYCYHISIYVNSLSYTPDRPISDLFSFWEFLDNAGIQYFVMLVLTAGIWWIIFRKLKHLSLKYRLLFHIIGFPVFIFLSQRIYYLACDLIGSFHLNSYAQIWDIFIPALFYLLQFGFFHAYEHYQNNQRNLQLKAELSKAALKSELSALKAQLNPHFLYNVFNTISASVPSDQEQTRELIAKLSDLFRYQLKASKEEMVPLRDELEFIRKYLDLEKARYEERLQVKIEVPETIMDTLIPPMLLQPLVENSIKHGIASLIGGGEISIRIYQDGPKIQFEVSDTGVGIKDKSQLFGEGIGLTNTKLRLEKQYNSELHITDNVPQGLKIQFAI